MKQSVFLSCICFLLLVSLLAAPALAATVTCPSSCSCLLPAEAKKLDSPGYCNGKQAICGYDSAKNEKYCFEKTAKTTPLVPQLVVTGIKPVVTTTVTTKLAIAPEATTFPVVGSITRVTPASCPDSCACIPDEKAELAAVPLSLCGSTKTWCGDTTAGIHEYCYAVPPTATVTTTFTPGIRERTEPCVSGCTCLSTDKAEILGLKRCIGTSTLPCDYDPAGRPMQCFVLDRAAKVSPVPATTTATPVPASGAAVPINLPVTGDATAPSRSPTIIDVITGFFGGLFTLPGGGERTGGATDATLNSRTATVSYCESRLGLTDCDGSCADLATDRAHCGSCGTACYVGEICCAGTCVRNTSAGNCGSCGNTCTAGSVCQNGACETWGCYFGNTNCNNVCVNTRTDPFNCGSCGYACPAGAICDDGSCDTCPFGTIPCNGRCVSPSDDRNNCGNCRNTCAGNEICSAGSCTACTAGFPDRCGNSCVDLVDDHRNCGSCGYACPEGMLCDGRECKCPGFDRGIIWCPSGGTTPVCVDPRHDPDYCGGCGLAHRCGAATPACCDASCTDMTSDRLNCGSCGNRCPDSKFRGAERCVSGTCRECDSGYFGCVAETGFVSCVDIKTSRFNCGGCGITCTEGETCCNGVCADLQDNRNNCGTCGHACGSGEVCCGGTCINVLFNDNNCGDCNHRCIRPDRSHCYDGRCCDYADINCL